MNDAAVDFILESLSPRPINNRGLIKRPSFYNDVDSWRRVLAYATTLFGVAPLLAVIERSSWKSDIPEAVLNVFQTALSHERMKLAILDEELELSLTALLEKDISVIILKGMDLGRRIYPDRIFRPMSDVDLLVPLNLFQEASNALESAGFNPIGKICRRHGRPQMEFSRSGAWPVVELHSYIRFGEVRDMRAEMGAVW